MGLFSKHTYRIVYSLCGLTSAYRNIVTFIRARSMGHAAKILDKREEPWNVNIISIERVE